MPSGVGVALAAVEYLQTQGESGAHYLDVCERFGIKDSDEHLGWFVGALRREGFLVQVEDATLFVLPEAPIRTGYWLRHPEYGVVKVTWARDGFPLVKVRMLGTVHELGSEFRVSREDLSGV